MTSLCSGKLSLVPIYGCLGSRTSEDICVSVDMAGQEPERKRLGIET